jgi:prolyl-tRNA synthetase
MRMSILCGRTLRAVFSGKDLVSHGLWLRAGFVHQLAAGLFSYLPLATRLQDKISIVLLEEMKACGNQKLSMPVVHPADV